MSSPDQIHGLRQQIALRRQPRYAPVLHALNELLQGLHPYSMGKQEYKSLASVDAFRSGPAGWSVTAPSASYLYRITGVKKLAEYETQWIGRVSRTANNEALFRYLRVSATRNGGWLPLTECAKGTLKDRRGFTWWTTYRIDPASVVQTALRLGIPHDRIQKYAVVMRCMLSAVQHFPIFRMPCAIDAFDNPVFQPMSERENAESGQTIHLDMRQKFRDGEPEFCLAALPVEAIEVHPVLVDASSRPSPKVLTYTSEFWTALATYYETLS